MKATSGKMRRLELRELMWKDKWVIIVGIIVIGFIIVAMNFFKEKGAGNPFLGSIITALIGVGMLTSILVANWNEYYRCENCGKVSLSEICPRNHA
ncbi:MAG: hypothetical protein Q7S60_05805 [bacterium]|nr:hypothetical protein [bacterium]